MKIYYQGEPGSYGHLASREIQKCISGVTIRDVIGLEDFDSVWRMVGRDAIAVLPIENSYAGSIHANVYNFLHHDYKIIGEYNFLVNHCLMSLEECIEDIEEVYSHHQALSQTAKYISSRKLSPKVFYDTAGAAKMISEKKKKGVGAIASSLAAEIYNLNILERNIQDQKNNTTKFIIVVPKDDTTTSFEQKKGRITLLIKTHHTPGSLYACLEAFASNCINMTKIESIPLGEGHFSYAFWITIEGSLEDNLIKSALEHLYNKSDYVKILGEY